MSIEERHIYVVGDFFAKYHGRRAKASPGSSAAEYAVHTYAHRITRAAYVWDPEIPAPDPINQLRPDHLDEVEIHFLEDPTGYGKPFRESLRDPIITDIRLEGVAKEHQRSFGTIRGKIYVKVHSVAI
jgi:hypothetical protein